MDCDFVYDKLFSFSKLPAAQTVFLSDVNSSFHKFSDFLMSEVCGTNTFKCILENKFEMFSAQLFTIVCSTGYLNCYGGSHDMLLCFTCLHKYVYAARRI